MLAIWKQLHQQWVIFYVNYRHNNDAHTNAFRNAVNYLSWFFLLHFSWDEKKISESNRPGTTSSILVNNRLLVYHIYPVAANLSLLLSNNSYKHQIPLSRFQKSRSRAKLLLNSPRLGDHMPRLRDLNEILASRKWLLSRRLEVGGSFFSFSVFPFVVSSISERYFITNDRISGAYRCAWAACQALWNRK